MKSAIYSCEIDTIQNRVSNIIWTLIEEDKAEIIDKFISEIEAVYEKYMEYYK